MTKKKIIVVIGLGNNGKTELINCLLNGGAIVEGCDVPGHTRSNSIYALSEDIMLMDTPGFGVNNLDTKEAMRGVREADIILWCHNLRQGSLNKMGVTRLTALKNKFGENIIKKISFVFTNYDNLHNNEEESERIKTIFFKELKDIFSFRSKEWSSLENKFSIKSHYLVGIHRFLKGNSENKINMIEKSNIPKLRNDLISALRGEKVVK